MKIIILNSSDVPIYEQIENEIKRLIAIGELKPDEALPGMRSLAKDLKVSVITTKRAYNDLEKDGFIYTVSGRGSFVSKVDQENVKADCLSKIRNLLTDVVKIYKSSGIKKKEVLDLFNEVENESFRD
ncbi:GntR family transcriptional regulator [Peptoniphilus asaccharolyticus DSM 20463]|uniref:GntR family transcriptional regulator n=1 Tax=Peptoniphilus asaccharolyticus DSM 20463 TaxID=573058 RepID=A0A1W1UHA1_PEPAS|nr:GntR family transcriptional regulator [Peptoniphilus asaccharolyticus]MBL7574724.1 GntR family transcriptional regulator [Peptoniphilus asaccharolyticus]SMB80498.1 GntR family transcriptional regulator [Peptoniphilus asaccharolyticus DSM 20463]